MAPKPQLRNLGQRQWAICIYGSLAASAVLAVWYKHNILEARKIRFDEFNRSYDEQKEFQRMKARGIFKGFIPE